MSDAPICPQHPRETGKSSPWNKCLTCWEAYLERRARECEEITPDHMLGYGRAIQEWVEERLNLPLLHGAPIISNWPPPPPNCDRDGSPFVTDHVTQDGTPLDQLVMDLLAALKPLQWNADRPGMDNNGNHLSMPCCPTCRGYMPHGRGTGHGHTSDCTLTAAIKAAEHYVYGGNGDVEVHSVEISQEHMDRLTDVHKVFGGSFSRTVDIILAYGLAEYERLRL